MGQRCGSYEVLQDFLTSPVREDQEDKYMTLRFNGRDKNGGKYVCECNYVGKAKQSPRQIQNTCFIAGGMTNVASRCC